MKTSGIVIVAICALHLLIMLCLYFPLLDLFDLWDHITSNDLVTFRARSFGSFFIAWTISITLFYFAYKAMTVVSNGFIKYTKTIAFAIAGLYFFFLSGQNISTHLGTYEVDEYFSVFKIRNVLTYSNNCADGVSYEQNDGIFYARFTTRCDSVSGTVISGIGPFLKLR